MFVKGEHERQFAYEAHTVRDNRGFVLGVEVTAGNVYDSSARDAVYDDVTRSYNFYARASVFVRRKQRLFDKL